MNILVSIRNPLDDGITSFFEKIATSSFGETWVEMNTIISCFFVFFFLIAFMFLFSKEKRTIGILMFVSLIITFLMNDLVFKNIISRNRPFVDLNIDPLGFHIDGYSFPSGHSALSFSGASTFFFYYLFISKRENKTYLAYSIIFLVIAFLIALSRIALLHHYFTDCLAGSLEGIIFGLIVVLIYKYLILKRLKKSS